MKKYLYKIFAFVLAIGCSGVLSACASGETDYDSNSVSEYQKEVVFDFESEKELIYSAVYREYNGKVEISDDKRYVTNGEHCAKFTFKPKVNDARIAFLPGTKYLNKIDYTDTIAYELDVYNDSGEEIEVCFSYGENVFTVLKAGANHLVIPVKREAVEMTGPADLSFWVRGVNNASIEKDYTLYLDKLTAVKETKKVLPKEVDYSGDSAYKFDHEYEVFNTFVWQGDSDSLFTRPRYSLNRNSKYILTGTGSLKADFFTKKDGSGVSTYGFRTVRGSNLIDWNAYDYDTTYISTDIYNDCDVDLTFDFYVFTATNNAISVRSVIKSHSWSNPSETRILLRDILDLGVTENLDIMTIVFGFNGMEAKGGTIYLDNISFER